jgi:hypothetical protein
VLVGSLIAIKQALDGSFESLLNLLVSAYGRCCDVTLTRALLAHALFASAGWNG